MRAASRSRLSSVGAIGCAVFTVAVACGSSDGKHESPEPGSGAGGESAEGGTGGTSRGGAAGSVAGDSGRAGRGGSSLGGAAGEAGSGGAGSGGDPSGCPDCPGGVCLDDGTCVDCVADEQCDDPTPHCEPGDHVCVECLPSDDDCPDGSYCAADFVCVPGCKAAASCASGSCLSSHDCDHCLVDGECAEDRVCATGTCSDTCAGEGQSCGSGRTCCSERCVDTSRDVLHCGGCDGPSSPHACNVDEFCGSTGCSEAIVANLCLNARVALVRDTLAPDVAAGTVLGDALATCPSAPVVRSVAPGAFDVSNTTTGQPVAGSGEVLVVAGGPFGQVTARFLEEQRIAAVRHVFVNNRFEMQRSSDDSVIATMPTANSNATHDHVLFEVVRDPPSGTLIFIVSGFNESGTRAGAWYFENVMLPALGTFDKAWYVYEWADGGANQLPDSSDTFTRLGEAP